ncbi:MAG: hypothetical protein ACXADB_03990 [Candidatus Hermodarchaeia archaeon]|jgi:hypothetical protein
MVVNEESLIKEFGFSKISDPKRFARDYFWEPDGGFSGWEPNLKDMEYEIVGIDGEVIVDKFWPILQLKRVVVCRLTTTVDGKDIGFTGWAVGSICDTGSADYPVAGFVLARMWAGEDYEEDLDEIYECIQKEIKEDKW